MAKSTQRGTQNKRSGGEAQRKSAAKDLVIDRVVRKWRLSPHLPPNPNVKLVFLGLMIFCYNDASEECEIAFHRGTGDHDLIIQVYKDCVPIFGPYIVGPGVRNIAIGTGGKKDVSFYYEGSPDAFDRVKGARNDFRWLLDLEDAETYAGGLEKEKKFFKTKLHVQQGTFYTVAPTNSKFKFKKGMHSGKKRGRVARCIASRIEMSGKECLSFKVDDNELLPFSICASSGASYEIYFRNECKEPDGTKCDKSDFHLIFDALKNIPGGKSDLELDGSAGVSSPLPGLCITGAESNDESPCMGAGFGQTGGFPSS